MKSTKGREYLRAHVLGLVAIFIALSGTAVAANGGGQSAGDANATASAVSNAKFKKLKQRVAALEAKTTYPPSGPAGGDLSGSYPNPSIAAGAVKAPSIADGAVQASKLGTIVTRASSVPLNAGTSNTVTANCNAGERIISGGGVVVAIIPSETIPITRSIKTGTSGSPGNGWQVSANNTTGVNAALTAQAYCLQ